jgi:hypothetical protein
VPTSPTTGATRRSSGLAPVSSTAEPPPPPRTLSGVPLLPEIRQSSYPPHRVALAAVPEPPRHRLTPKSGRPPPPCSGRRSLHCLHVGCASAGSGPCPVLCQRTVSLPRGWADAARPWAACFVQTGHVNTVDMGRAGTVQLGHGGFSPVIVDLFFFYFPNIFKSLQIQKNLCRIRLYSENYETNFIE